MQRSLVIDERTIDYDGNCGRLDLTPGIHLAKAGDIHLTEKILSGDKR
jgi:hypothetical protein